MEWRPEHFEREREHIRREVENVRHKQFIQDYILVHAIADYFSVYENELDERKPFKDKEASYESYMMDREFDLWEKYDNMFCNMVNFGSTSLITALENSLVHATEDRDKTDIVQSLLHMVKRAYEDSKKWQEETKKLAKEIGFKIPSEKTAGKYAWISKMPLD